jgi:hypothetical protein
MEGHLNALVQVVVMAGAGFDCNGVYHALVEVAEIYRKVGGFASYTAGNEYANEIASGIAQGLARHRAQDAQRAYDHFNDAHGHDTAIDAEYTDQGSVPTEPDVKRPTAYDRLSPAAKKRFN